ncbi:TrkH family potassium uptake protein [Ruixingdingia sedimenti]|uniref:Trk system potassium uptake protein n=1 Tax=Ruixingdingia sedimenti TaxID=3073604 RepID=A0ABU1F6J9_9RHOB|nr:TrkH family potassium uptake protein [Xinfangfangia sp. LG-4]MDR5652492.1 TrkH family potassium uptake protein [Xinfangfangia sp. LG-4]
MIDLRPVGYVIGLLIATLGAAMLFPMALDLATGNGHWQAFLQSAVITILAGALLALACANAARSLTVRQAFVLTTGVWVMLPLFGSLPFMLGEPGANLTDAVFEAMSGMTTTGATVFVGLDALPQGTNLWRGILQWLGGLGIVIVALIFLPVMKVGGMQFFRSEGFDTMGKILPRALDISAALIRIYIGLTLACVVSFLALGLSGFDAVVHALATVSTGGFSSYDASFAAFAGPAEYAAAVFMVLASLPFIRFVQLTQGSWLPFWRDPQVRAYLRWTGYVVAMIVAYRVLVLGAAPLTALREVLFNTVSIWSGTGFLSADVLGWGPFAFVLLMIAGFIGGCTSSTGCSVKVFRYLIVFEAVKTQIRRLLSPHAVQPVRYDGRPVDADIVNSVIVFFTLFVLSFGVLAVALSMTGLQTRTALTAAWTSIANIGPAWGAAVGQTGALHQFPDAAKWLMIAGMLVGRLELLSVYVLFTARFWGR